MILILSSWVLIAVRILTVTLTAPVLGNRSVSPWIRLGLALCLALVAAPAVIPAMLTSDAMANATTNSVGQWIEWVLLEAFLGGLLGFGMSIMFLAASMGGTVLGQMAGIQLFSNDDDTGGGPMARLFSLVSIAVFVAVGGIDLVVSGVLDSFARLPVGATFDSFQISKVHELLIELCHQSFLLVLRCVAPAVVAMLIATYVVNMLNRALPGLNSMGVGLTSNLAIMTLSVLLTLGGTLWLLISDVEASMDWIQQILRNLEP